METARAKFKTRSSNESYYSEIDNWDTITFLDKAKITVNGKITNTALILLGKSEKSHYLLPSISEITWKLDTEEGIRTLWNAFITEYNQSFTKNKELSV